MGMGRKPEVKRLQSQRDYDQQKYWNDRYAAKLKGDHLDDDDDDDHTDEWYFSYGDISDLLKPYFKQCHRHAPVLDIGCGLSNIFDDLSEDDFNGPFVGIDYSPIVIKQCKKNKNNANYHYLTMDMMTKPRPSLPFPSFGVIIDKGTTDAILCEKSHLSAISHLYEHASSLLSSEGLFVLITIRTVDDKRWFEGCLIPSLIRGSETGQTKFIIHFHQCETYTDGSENGPNVFVIVKYRCKSYPLRSSAKQGKPDVSRIVTVKCY